MVLSLPPGFDQLMSVYARNATTGKYTDLVTSGVGCRLAHVNRQPAATGAARAELAGIRVLLWDPAYVLPENAQIAVDGVTGPDGVTAGRFNVKAGTLATMRGPSGQACYRQADVTRAT